MQQFSLGILLSVSLYATGYTWIIYFLKEMYDTENIACFLCTLYKYQVRGKS